MFTKKEDIKMVCTDCGMEFVFTIGEQIYFTQSNLCFPKRCQGCRKIKKDKIENEKWQETESRKIKMLLKRLNCVTPK